MAVSYRSKKPKRYKPKRSIWRSKFLWSLILLLGLASAAGYFILFSSYFQIADINVTGNQEVKTEELQRFVAERINQRIFIFQTKSILLVSPNELQEEISKAFPHLSEARFLRRLPRTIVLRVQERQPAAVWCLQDSEETAFMRCFSIDSNGIAFQQVDSESGANLPILRDANSREMPNLGSAVINKDTLDGVLALEKELTEALRIPAREITLLSENRVNVVTQEGWEIYFELPIEISWQMTRLKLLLEKEIPAEKQQGLEYIDMRYSKVYYRYRD